MARVAVCSIMYLGDVAPFLAVARELGNRGHDVVGVFPEGFRSYAEREPFEFQSYALDASPAALHLDAEHQRLIEHPLRNSLALGRLLMARGILDDVEGAIASLESSFAGAEVVVTHPIFASVAVPVAQSMGIPVVCGHLFPMTIATESWGPPVGRWSLRVRGRLARLLWRGLEVGTDVMFAGAQLNELRRRIGVEPRRGAATDAWTDADRVILLVSEHWFNRMPVDWPEYRWGGFTAWAPVDAGLDPEVRAYIEAGKPPVLVSLGTSAASVAKARFRDLYEQLVAMGERPLLLSGSTVELGGLADEPGVFRFAPLDLVAPHCSAAVLSGSLGSLAAAGRAGIPTVVYPVAYEQMWNAGQAERLGVGVAARSARQISGALQRALDDQAMKRRAQALATAMEGEDGARSCAEVIEELLG